MEGNATLDNKEINYYSTTDMSEEDVDDSANETIEEGSERLYRDVNPNNEKELELSSGSVAQKSRKDTTAVASSEKRKQYEKRKTVDEELTEILCSKGSEIDKVVLKYTGSMDS